MDQKIVEKLEGIENLPTLPIIVDQINKLIKNPNSSMADIALVISRDQAIASRVIRLVNSAYYGLNRRISSIKQAIVILGLNAVKNITLGVSIVKSFQDKLENVNFDVGKFWLHSFCVAQMSKLIAIELQQQEPEDFFLAGLLHDMGIIVLNQNFNEHFNKILRYSDSKVINLNKAEKAVMGITHEDIGSYLAKNWKLPDLLSVSIKYHHNPNLYKDTEFIKIIKIVNKSELFSNYYNIVSPKEIQEKECFSPKILYDDLTKIEIEDIYSRVKKDLNGLMREWGI